MKSARKKYFYHYYKLNCDMKSKHYFTERYEKCFAHL